MIAEGSDDGAPFSTDDTLPRRFRSRFSWVGGAFVVFAGVSVVGLAVVVGLQGDGGGVIAVSLFGVVFIVLGVRALQVGVIATTDGVVVRNPLRVRRLAWGAIDHAELGQFRSEGGNYQAVVIVLLNGSRVKTVGLSTSGIDPAASLESCESFVRQLNGLRDRLA